jgi:hypothetical protein
MCFMYDILNNNLLYNYIGFMSEWGIGLWCFSYGISYSQFYLGGKLEKTTDLLQIIDKLLSHKEVLCTPCKEQEY